MAGRRLNLPHLSPETFCKGCFCYENRNDIADTFDEIFDIEHHQLNLWDLPQGNYKSMGINREIYGVWDFETCYRGCWKKLNQERLQNLKSRRLAYAER